MFVMELETVVNESQFQKWADFANFANVVFKNFRLLKGTLWISVCPIRPSG